MSCSKCQNNNSNCNEKCGCAEPICPTPQPCTEITDSKCIIYTDDTIKCGNDAVILKNTNLSNALKDIVEYVCENQSSGPAGPAGVDGAQGVPGQDGINGVDGINGQDGADGQDGLSAYEIWLSQGNTGDENDFLIAITGPQGEPGQDGTCVGCEGLFQFQYEIGQYVEEKGGVIIHRWASSIPYESPALDSVQNYLVMDISDLNFSAEWGLDGNNVLNCESLNDGLANTNAMLAESPDPGTASVLCDNSTNGGFNDWYLPALDELRFMFENRFLINLNSFPFIPTTFARYWSSTELNSASAWQLSFIDGVAQTNLKTDAVNVRAVRKFSI